MIVATIAIAALLGSASVAQAGRKCIACDGASEEDISDSSPDVIEKVKRKQKFCAREDLSGYLASPIKMLPFISIKGS